MLAGDLFRQGLGGVLFRRWITLSFLQKKFISLIKKIKKIFIFTIVLRVPLYAST